MPSFNWIPFGTILGLILTVQAKPGTLEHGNPGKMTPLQLEDEHGERLGVIPDISGWRPGDTWTSSARLPSSAKTGGNENTRYNIRRDGSLSIALQPHSISLLPWNVNPLRKSAKELRSFSIVLSDVDVSGSYSPKNLNHRPLSDAYSEAGVSSYRLHSNSIHRMNASWRLNSNKTDISQEKLKRLLSGYSSDPKEPRYETYQNIGSTGGSNESEISPGISKLTPLYQNEPIHSIFMNEGNSTEGIEFHDLKTGSSGSSGFSNNNNNPREKNGAERSALRDSSDEDVTALKKLMSLLFKSGESVTSMTKEGAQVLNVLIPNGKSEAIFIRNPQVKEILKSVLGNPESSTIAKQIAGALYSPPNRERDESMAYQYTTGGNPCSNCDPAEDIKLTPINEDYLKPINPHLTVASTPDGFPLTGNGFLNLNHPNLQFHQALHHLLVNGTAPTALNVTAKTNVINVFVINFHNDASLSRPPQNDVTGFRPIPTKKKPSYRPLRPPSLFSQLSKIIESSSSSSSKLQIPDSHLEVLNQFTTKKPTTPPRFPADFQNYWSHSVPSTTDSYTSSKSPTLVPAPSTRIDIMELLPHKLSPFTRIETEDDNKPLAQLLSYFRVGNQNLSSTTVPINAEATLRPELAQVSWLFTQKPKQNLHPGKRRRPQSHDPVSEEMKSETLPSRPHIKEALKKGSSPAINSKLTATLYDHIYNKTNFTSTNQAERPTKTYYKMTDLNLKDKRKEKVNNLITALGISAIPTLAAGAAATWPYWAPMLVSGRQLSVTDQARSNFHVNSSHAAQTATGDADSGSSTFLKDMKSRAGKWIKVDVITESFSPTSSEMTKSDSQNTSGTNNRDFESEVPQDVPLVQNFFQNVLGNDWNPPSTAIPHSSSSSLRPESVNEHKIPLNMDTKVSLFPPPEAGNRNETSTFTSNWRPHSPQWSPIKKLTSSHLLTVYEMKEAKKRMANVIKDAETAYSSASLFPMWFPLLIGKWQENSDIKTHPISNNSFLT